MAKKDTQKLQRERLQVYNAHQKLHERQVTRRKRDQLGSAAIMVTAVALASLGYWAWSPPVDATEPVDSAVEEEVFEEESPENALDDSQGTVPDVRLSEYRAWDADMTIDGVSLELSLNGFVAPQAVANFLSLSRDGFFDDTSCHRLTTENIFVLQCGDPEGTGLGGPDYRFGPIENAPEDDIYPAGTLAMARVPGDGASMGSQFFIVWEESSIGSDEAGGYTVFGQVTAGLDELRQEVIDQGVQDDLTDGRPVAPATISSITIR